MESKTTKYGVVDPTSLGLFGLAMVTLVASTNKLGWTQGTALVLPWVIFLGSFAQLAAAYADSKRENLFGFTVFGGFGLFWLGVGLSWLIKMGALGEILANNADIKQFGFAFIGYLIFSVYVTIASLKTNRVIFLIVLFVTFLFIGLVFSTFDIEKEFFAIVAGYSELIVAILSFYGAAALLINAQFKKTVLPMGKF